MNLHPYVVHFAAGLLITSVLLFFIGTLGRDRPWSSGVLTTARWNLWIGAGCALASIGTGFVDYTSARCDLAIIESVIIHRRTGAVTWWSSLIAAIAVYRTRHRAPGPLLLGWLLLVGTAAVTVTYLGTQLTYGQGLGVERAWGEDAAACFELERSQR